jgi:asparagine synthase (glutamine-hydrolysing)
MPGLYGLVAYDEDIKAQANLMKNALISDWAKCDGQWVSQEDGIGIGQVDLGIFHHEPLPWVQQDSVLFIIGEIVNQEELIHMAFPSGKSSANLFNEALLTLFEQKGYQVFEFLNGSFAIAIWKATEKKLILACDYAGFRPLFYYHSGNKFCFASEIKAILALNWFPRQVENKAVLDLLGFGFPQGALTLFEKIIRLQPGMILIYQNGKVELKEGYQVRFAPQPSLLNEEEHVENVGKLFEKALLARIKPNLKTGLTLSGGGDTRLILAACSYLNLSIPTFTYGLNRSRDRERAKNLSKMAGFPHTSFALTEAYIRENASTVLDRCEGRVDCFQSHGLFLTEMRNWVNIMILGNGGEYLFSSVNDYYPESLKNSEDPYEKYYHFRNTFFKEQEWPKLFRENIRKLKDYPREKMFELLHLYDPINVEHAIDAYWFNDVQMNRTLQGLFMINHVMEFSEPYFDRDLIIYATSLPIQFRKKRMIQNALIEKYNQKMAFVEGGHLYQQPPLQKFVRKTFKRTARRLVRYNIADKKIVARPSATFTDLHRLTRLSSNRKWIESVLLDRNGKIYEFVQPEYIQDIVKKHMSAETNFTKQLNTLMTLELFLQNYI